MDSLVFRLLILSAIMYGVLASDAGRELDLKSKIAIILWVDIIYALVERFPLFSLNIRNVFCYFCGSASAAGANDDIELERIAARQRAAINSLNA
jgi:hypothetical protein